MRLSRLLQGGTLHVRSLKRYGVKELVVHDFDAHGGEGVCDSARLGVDALGDRLKAVGAVVDRVHSGHYGQQNLCGTNV